MNEIQSGQLSSEKKISAEKRHTRQPKGNNSPVARYDFEELRRACAGRWDSIVRALSHVDISEALDRRKHVRCPKGHGKTKQQFRVFGDFDQTGGGVCNTCGSYADGFNLLGFLNGWDRRQSVKEVSRYMEDCGYLPQKTEKPIQRPPERRFEVQRDKAEALAKVWRCGLPIEGTLGESYLRNRGITGKLPDSGDVRFHPALRYWDEDSEQSLGDFPAIISLIRSSKAGHPLSIHRIYLDPKGGKAKVPRAKKLMSVSIEGAISELGAAIRVYKLKSKVIGITEGLETAMAIRSAHPGFTVWAAYSAHVLTNFQPPRYIRRVNIFGDVDESGTGQAAAARLAIRLDKEGYHAQICLPSAAITLPPKDSGWYNAEATKSQIQQRLQKDGYTIAEQCNARDWLDAWNEARSKGDCLNAVKRTRPNG